MTIPPGPTHLQVETATSLWTLCTPDAPPDIELHDWKCFDLTPPGKPTTGHFLGRNGQSPSVYTSAPVIKFDPVNGVGEATDGAVIRLAGPHSCDSLDAPGYIVDVSADVVEFMNRPVQFSWAETDEHLLLQIESHARIRAANPGWNVELVLWGRTLTSRQLASVQSAKGADKLAAAHALLYDAHNWLD